MSYSDRLLRRVIEKVAEISPEGIGKDDDFWEALGPANSAFSEAIEAFERGEIDKQQLDTAAMDYLSAWRGKC